MESVVAPFRESAGPRECVEANSSLETGERTAGLDNEVAVSPSLDSSSDEGAMVFTAPLSELEFSDGETATSLSLDSSSDVGAVNSSLYGSEDEAVILVSRARRSKGTSGH